MSTNTSSQDFPLQFVPESEGRFRLLFENSLDGILLTSPDGRIYDANPSACALLGRTREQIIAATRADLVDTSDPTVARLVEERKRTGKAHGELIARHSDGTLFPIEISSVVFSDAEGNQFTCMMIRDISSRRRAEAEREQLIVELQEALSKVKLLSGLLSICASCKKIHNEHGHWESLETYIRNRSAADFSHGLCPECLQRLYPGSLQG
jgi:PAS domain S-box-containing protein